MNSLATTTQVAIDDSSQVAEARRLAVRRAQNLEMDDTARGKLALALTEAATNILKHAGHGRILIRALRRNGFGGIQVLALDKGPGIASVAESMRDGHSTTGTMGTGLGALMRLTTAFEIHSERGKGTVISFEIWPQGMPGVSEPLAAGILCVALPTESVSGDSWTLTTDAQRHTLLVVDGLGHGAEAATAARAAVDAVEATTRSSVVEQMESIHGALRSTRGAAAAVAVLDLQSRTVKFCGIGNIAACVRHDGKTRNLVSFAGILGHTVRHIREFEMPFPVGALLIASSDGLSSRWDLDDYPGLETRRPATIAGVLFRDFSRERDDVTVAVLRANGDRRP